MKLTEYLNAINYTKESLMDTQDDQIERKYAPYVINRCLSYFIDTVIHASEDFSIVKEYYDYNNSKTREVMSLLKPEDIDYMRTYLSGGGINSQ